jgi:hypothetical protein
VEEPVVYSPPACIQWFEVGAGGIKQDARAKAKAAKVGLQEKDLGTALKEGLSAAMRAGRAAMANLAGKRSEATEVRLYEDHFELVSLLKTVSIPYKEVRSIAPSPGGKHRYTLTLRSGEHTLSPVAYLVSGSARVPVGWQRNGMEVPYLLLIEELAARCGVEVTGLG